MENVTMVDNEYLQMKSTLAREFRTIDLDEEFNEISCYKVRYYLEKIEQEDKENEIENPDENENVKKVKQYAKTENAEVIPLCVKLEEELSTLDKEDKIEMLHELGLEESGLDKVIKASYKLLGLMSFLTAGEPEVRAWTIKIGTKAPKAAGKIHSDIERGFIRAEVVSYEDLIREGSMNAVKEKGLMRLEGKDYIMQDGDIVLFRFNV